MLLLFCLLYAHCMAICLGYYELSLLLVLVFQFLRGTPKKHSPASFFVFLPFVVFTLFGLKNARVFSKCFLSNISFWAKNLLKKSQAKSGQLISSAPLCKFKRAGFTLETLAKSNQKLLAKRKHDFLTAAALEMPAICCPSILVVS